MQEAASGPTAWQTQLQCLLAAASIQLPAYPPATISQQTQAPSTVLSAAMLAVMTNLADEVQKQLPAWGNKTQADGYSQTVGLGQLLARVQWQLLGLVEGLYAGLAATASTSPPRRSLDVKVAHLPDCSLQLIHELSSTCTAVIVFVKSPAQRRHDCKDRACVCCPCKRKYVVHSFAQLMHGSAAQVLTTERLMQDQLQQKGLLQALQLLLTLRKLDSSTPQTPESQLQLLSTNVSLLVDAGILGLSGGSFLKTCLAALAPSFKGGHYAAVRLRKVCAIPARPLKLCLQVACVKTVMPAALGDYLGGRITEQQATGTKQHCCLHT